MLAIDERMTEIIQLDHDILLFVNSLHCTFFDYFMKACSDKLVWTPFYVALFVLFLRTFGWRKACYALLAIALTILLTDQLTASLIRPVVARLRPANLDNPLSAMVHVVDGYRGGAYGFPSSHAANTAGLTFFVIQVFRKRAMLWLMVGWMLLVCYSRMYLGVHFLGDILVGIIIGAVIGTLMARVFLAISSKLLLPADEIENGQADVQKESQNRLVQGAAARDDHSEIATDSIPHFFVDKSIEYPMEWFESPIWVFDLCNSNGLLDQETLDAFGAV